MEKQRFFHENSNNNIHKSSATNANINLGETRVDTRKNKQIIITKMKTLRAITGLTVRARRTNKHM